MKVISAGGMRRVAGAALLVIALSLGYATGSRSGNGAKDGGCSATSECMKCNLSSCGMLGEDEHYEYGSWTTDVRCVDYDHVSPAHCAVVSYRPIEIRDQFGYLQGTCDETVCCYGSPLSEECSNPYSCP